MRRIKEGENKMKNIRQDVNNCKIPGYLQDILTNNYCPNFLRMSMVRESDDYTFRYQEDRYKKIQVDKLTTYMKIVLLKSLLDIIDKNEEWLIGGESYMIEPELVYSINNSVDAASLKLLFYPDYEMNDVSEKVASFSKKITNLHLDEEVDIMSQFANFIQANNWNKARIFLDKNILRMETRS